MIVFHPFGRNFEVYDYRNKTDYAILDRTIGKDNPKKVYVAVDNSNIIGRGSLATCKRIIRNHIEFIRR